MRSDRSGTLTFFLIGFESLCHCIGTGIEIGLQRGHLLTEQFSERLQFAELLFQIAIFLQSTTCLDEGDRLRVITLNEPVDATLALAVEASEPRLGCRRRLVSLP